MGTITLDKPVEAFIARWSASEGAERANFQLFAAELCDLIGVPRPKPSVSDAEANPYAFERGVKFRDATGATTPGRIDLYKRGAFVMEAKQSREKGGPKELRLANTPDLFAPDARPQGQRGANRAWDVLMLNARRQAEDYAKALPTADGWPPFILVCDVGHCIEVYSDFTGQGKNYAQFPDRQSYRIYMEDLRDDKMRERLRHIWDDPHKLNPALQSSKVTREISARLAAVSKRLEGDSHDPEDVALFLMRCLFTMFAEDVKLLPEDCFKNWLDRARTNPDKFAHELAQLWQAMDSGGYATIAEAKVKRFNGSFFKNASVIPLRREEIGELLAAAKADWREVDPAIFGTLLEQALSEKERGKLGAHYTPRAYVERLVVVTVIEPLRQKWAQVQATAERFKLDADALEQEAREAGSKGNRKQSSDKASEAKGKRESAMTAVREFHARLCTIRVLDPACGTGNFLYVALELMKKLEGDVLEAVLELGGAEGFTYLGAQTVDPHQFLGLEVNPRAAAIAEMVIWLGFLQRHLATKGDAPPEPILHDFKNIRNMDAVLTWDGYPVPAAVADATGKRRETFPNARRPEWPEADYIVGNPPFIGGKDVRANLGDAYAETLWAVHDGRVNESADFVMYWWDRAAETLLAKNTKLQRFGFVTTNSITQVFSRRVIARHLEAKLPLSIIMAIPDHPWRKRKKRIAGEPFNADEENHANVRVAMTVAMAGKHDGVSRDVVTETALDTDEPIIETDDRFGRINGDLTAGLDITAAAELSANGGLSSRGMSLHGAGFIVTPEKASALGLGTVAGLERHVRHYRNGRDLMSTPRGVMVIDLFGVEADDVRKRFPHVYQHVLATVKPERDANNRATYRDNWWTFGEPRKDLRPALAGLPRYIATVETAKHRVCQFLDAAILPDNKLVCMGLDDAFHHGVLSSRVHVGWAMRAGGWLGVGNDSVYVKSRCFDPFPFPDCSDALKARIRATAEELDAHRKARQAAHPRLTLTQMYNVLEAIRAAEDLDADAERIKQEGLVLILRELHDTLDVLVLEAYGWTDQPTDDQILERLVALNAARAAEEKAGTIRWLRPDYQIPKFGSDAEQSRLKAERAAAKTAQLDFDGDDTDDAASKPKYPTGDELAETAAIMRVLMTAPAPLSVAAIASGFAQGSKIERRVAVTVQALARLSHIATSDGGESFALQRVGMPLGSGNRLGSGHRLGQSYFKIKS